MGEKKKRGTGKWWITNLILLVCVVVFLVSICKLIGYLTEYKKGEQSYEEMAQHVTVPEVTKNKKGEEVVKAPVVDWESLEEVNPDLVAWIYVDGTDIQYPVVQGTDNDHYLHYTFDGKKNSCGTIFMDMGNKADFTSDNTILYGHNMKTGKMFGSLNFYEDEDYLEEHPDIWIVTKDRALKYKIFSVYETDASSDAYTLEFGSEDSKQTYLDNSKANSMYDTGVKVETKHQLLTLSTCTSVTEDGRFLVQAKLVSDEEIKNEE